MPFLEHCIMFPLMNNELLVLLLKSNILGTILNIQNMQETNVSITHTSAGQTNRLLLNKNLWNTEHMKLHIQWTKQ